MATLAAVTRMAAIDTYADALDCLLRLGLVARLKSGELVPNPAPPSVWNALALPHEQASQIRLQALASDYQHLEGDLLHVLRWGPPDGLVATPGRIAIRLSLSSADVIATLRLLELRGFLRVAPDIDHVDSQTEVTIRATVEPLNRA